MTNNGTLALEGNVDGGTIQIESGMLDYTAAGIAPGAPGATGFDLLLALTGAEADLRFFGFQSIEAVYNPSSNALSVSDPTGKLIVDIPLASNRAYSASDFHTSGIDVIYTAPPGV